MTKHADLFTALAAPFAAGEVKSRRQGNRDMKYVTARTVMNRLDWVVGPENWWDHYTPLERSVICELTIRLPDGQLLTKSDCGGCAGLDDQGDDDKSGFSDAFKRAAVKFGVGRYLYGDGVAELGPAHSVAPPCKGGDEGGLGRDQSCAPTPSIKQAPLGRPTTGRELYAWLKKASQLTRNYVEDWAKGEEYDPRRIVGWTEAQVTAAWKAIVSFRSDPGTKGAA